MPQDIHAYSTERRDTHEEQPTRRQRAFRFLAAGSTGEAVAGAAAVVLAIVGLSGVVPFYMVTIAAICAGAALLLEGSAIASQFKRLEREINESTKTQVTLGGGMAFEVFGGIAGIALGIIALVGVVPGILTSSAAIAMGASLVLGAGATERLDKARTHWHAQEDSRAAHWLHDSVLGAAGLQVLTGLAAIALGIVALAGVTPGVLDLVAMLCLGSGVLLAGAAITGKMSTAIRH